MKGKTANAVLVVALLGSIPLFFVFLKPYLSGSTMLTELLPLPQGKMWDVFRGQVVRIPHLCIVFGMLVVFGYRRRDVFLSRGDLSLEAEAFKPFGIRNGESWWKIGRNVGVVVVGITLVFSLLSLKPSVAASGEALWQMPLIILNASMNAFYEEFIFRAALIPPLLVLVGKSKTIWITSLIFGAAHLDGNQLSGILFAFMAAYLGLLLAKSMIETKGILFAWGLHCAVDIVIFLSMTMVALQGGGGNG